MTAEAAPTSSQMRPSGSVSSTTSVVGAIGIRPMNVIDYSQCPQVAGNDVTVTQSTGTPVCGFWWYVQRYISQYNGYTGTINGVMGPNSWKGVQTWLNNEFGAGLVVDGVAGTNTNKALQRALNSLGWPEYATGTLTVDGVRGPLTYRAWATYVIGISN